VCRLLRRRLYCNTLTCDGIFLPPAGASTNRLLLLISVAFCCHVALPWLLCSHMGHVHPLAPAHSSTDVFPAADFYLIYWICCRWRWCMRRSLGGSPTSAGLEPGTSCRLQHVLMWSGVRSCWGCPSNGLGWGQAGTRWLSNPAPAAEAGSTQLSALRHRQCKVISSSRQQQLRLGRDAGWSSTPPPAAEARGRQQEVQQHQQRRRPLVRPATGASRQNAAPAAAASAGQNSSWGEQARCTDRS
jgi:hypothetical protein